MKLSGGKRKEKKNEFTGRDKTKEARRENREKRENKYDCINKENLSNSD